MRPLAAAALVPLLSGWLASCAFEGREAGQEGYRLAMYAPSEGNAPSEAQTALTLAAEERGGRPNDRSAIQPQRGTLAGPVARDRSNRPRTPGLHEPASPPGTASRALDAQGLQSPVTEAYDALTSAGSGQLRVSGSEMTFDLGEIGNLSGRVRDGYNEEPLEPQIPVWPPGQEQGEQAGALELTLEDSLEIALENNLQIQIARLARDALEPEVRRRRAFFDPTVGLASDLISEDTVSNTDPKSHLGSQALTYFVSQALPTGGSMIVATNLLSEDETDAVREFTSGMSLTVIQPLMRGGRVFVATRPILDAEFDLRIEEARFRTELLRVGLLTKVVYYNTVLAQQIIRATEDAIERDRVLLEASEALLKAGLVTIGDVVSAQSQLAQDQASLVSAQGDLVIARNQLLDVLGYPLQTAVTPVDHIGYEPIELAAEDWSAVAVKLRPEIMEIEEALKKSSLNMDVAESDIMPQVDFVGTFGRAQTDTSFGRSLGFDGHALAAGVVFSIPIGNVAATENFRRAKLEHTRLSRELLQRQRQVELEVRSAVTRLRTNLEAISAQQSVLELVRKEVEIAKARFALGFDSNFDIIEAQEDLLDAEVDLKTAIIDYNIALAELEASVGGTLL